jgi:hypothetical protein
MSAAAHRDRSPSLVIAAESSTSISLTRFASSACEPGGGCLSGCPIARAGLSHLCNQIRDIPVRFGEEV